MRFPASLSRACPVKVARTHLLRASRKKASRRVVRGRVQKAVSTNLLRASRKRTPRITAGNLAVGKGVDSGHAECHPIRRCACTRRPGAALTSVSPAHLAQPLPCPAKLPSSSPTAASSGARRTTLLHNSARKRHTPTGIAHAGLVKPRLRGSLAHHVDVASHWHLNDGVALVHLHAIGVLPVRAQLHPTSAGKHVCPEHCRV